MKGPLDIHHYLLVHDVPHEIVRLPRLIVNADQLPSVLKLPPRRCVIVRPYYMSTGHGSMLSVVICPDDVPCDIGALRTAMHVPAVVPARFDRVSEQTDYLASHLAPVLLPPEVVVLAATELSDLGDTVVYAPTGDGGTALGIKADNLLALTQARLISTAPPTITLPEAAPRTPAVNRPSPASPASAAPPSFADSLPA